MSWIFQNIGTIIVLAALLAVVIGVIRYMKREKAAGKSSCGANCAHCALHDKCHGAEQKKQ